MNTTVIDPCQYVRDIPMTPKSVFDVYSSIAMALPTLIGILLNIFTMVVLHKMNHRSYYLVKVLAVYDVMFLIAVFIMFPLRTMYTHITRGGMYTGEEYRFGATFLYTAGLLFILSLFLRNWCIVLVSFERFVIIMFPLKSRQFWTPRVVNCILCLLNVFGFLASFPFMLPQFPVYWITCPDIVPLAPPWGVPILHTTEKLPYYEWFEAYWYET